VASVASGGGIFLTPHLLYSNCHGGLSSFSPSVKVAMLYADIAASNVTYKDGIYSFSLEFVKVFVQRSKTQDDYFDGKHKA
jgi:hypothetical protein